MNIQELKTLRTKIKLDINNLTNEIEKSKVRLKNQEVTLQKLTNELSGVDKKIYKARTSFTAEQINNNKVTDIDKKAFATLKQLSKLFPDGVEFTIIRK